MHNKHVILAVICHTHKVLIWENIPVEKVNDALEVLSKDPEDWDGALERLGNSTTATNAADINEAIHADSLFEQSDVVLDLSGEVMRRDSIAESCVQLMEFLTEQTA